MNQMECGACYAFATLSVLETTKCLLTKQKPKRLSVQQLIDCFDGDGYYFGCNGGAVERVLPYLQNINTIVYDECYHYNKERRECSFDYFVEQFPECLISVSSNNEMLSYKRLNGIEEMLQHLATIGPLIGYVKAPSFFEAYKDGIVTKEFCENSNSTSESNFGHFISIIGFGTEENRDFWLLKNSWGKNWGLDGGYGKIERGKNACYIEFLAFGLFN